MSAAYSRRPRADARRNSERLLAEADAAFREHGTQASLENIARRAGVAIGTLYAHFPNRLALVSALLRERHDALFGLGRRLLTDPPAEALAAWVRAVVAHAAAYRGLGALPDFKSAMHYSLDAITSYGHANLNLEEHWQLMGSIEALNGWLLFGLTTAFLFGMLDEVWRSDSSFRR